MEKYGQISEKAGISPQMDRIRVEGYKAMSAKELKKADKSDNINLQLFAYKSSDFKTVRLPRNEHALVMHELNTNMSKEDRALKVVNKPIGDYIYTVENNGFDNYRIIGKVKIEQDVAERLD